MDAHKEIGAPLAGERAALGERNEIVMLTCQPDRQRLGFQEVTGALGYVEHGLLLVHASVPYRAAIGAPMPRIKYDGCNVVPSHGRGWTQKRIQHGLAVVAGNGPAAVSIPGWAVPK